ncbi:hypothetical protein BGX28_000784 [Mortierella sp. GBA30]|nr:hypothetical protein BGX28_000784 [Mortierella sp. GBA30]
MSSAPSDAPKTKELKHNHVVAGSSGPSRPRGSQRTGGSNRAAHNFSEPETRWLVDRLRDAEVYLPLQAERDSTTRQTPKAKVHDKLAMEFNNNFVGVNIDSTQIKNKIASLKRQFKLADAKRNESGFGSTDSEAWRKILTDIFQYYFELEEAWTKSWGNAPTQYADSLSNLDNPLISEDEGLDQVEDDVPRERNNISIESEEEVEEGDDDEEEEESLIRRPRMQYQRTSHHNQTASAAQRNQLRQVAEQEQEQDERRQIVRSSTSKKSKKAERKDVMKQITDLNDVTRASIELEQATRQKEAEARMAKDAADSALAMKRLELEQIERDRAHERMMAEIEAKNAIKMAEVKAERDIAIRREELKAQADHSLELKQRDLDDKIAELDRIIASLLACGTKWTPWGVNICLNPVSPVTEAIFGFLMVLIFVVMAAVVAVVFPLVRFLIVDTVIRVDVHL